MIVGVILDGTGRPICCEMWPGNVTDVTTLISVVERLKSRFAIGSICVVADRGMISSKTITELESSTSRISYILGVRMHRQKEVREEVLLSHESFREVTGRKKKSKEPLPLAVREQMVERRRYIVCYNEDQAKKDSADRQAIVESLREKLKNGEKALLATRVIEDPSRAAARNTSPLTRPSSLRKNASTANGSFEPIRI